MRVRAALEAMDDSRLTAHDIQEVIRMAAISCGVPVANHGLRHRRRDPRGKGLERGETGPEP